MTLHIYHCETVTMRSELVMRNKPDGPFYGLRLHMNTDQAVTIWARSEAALSAMVLGLATTLADTPRPIREMATVPGQLQAEG